MEQVLAQHGTQVEIHAVVQRSLGANGLVGKVGEIPRIIRLVIAPDKTNKAHPLALSLKQFLVNGLRKAALGDHEIKVNFFFSKARSVLIT